MIRVKVPATSANMGPGFDSLGIALGLYNIIEAEETDGEMLMYAGKKQISFNSNNLIYKAMQKVFDECNYAPRGIKIALNSNIPRTRGLGSSSACIIGGMLSANIISGRQFEYGDLLNFAAEMEGHADNVTPAMYGGFCTSVYENGKVYHTSHKLVNGLRFAVMVPEYYVPTRESRTVLPESFSKSDTVYNISHASMFTAAMITGKTELLKNACKDRIHQRYRKNYVEHMEDIFEKSYELGSCATYLSGSGPTVLSVLNGNFNGFSFEMNRFFADGGMNWKCRVLKIDNVGAVVSTASEF